MNKRTPVQSLLPGERALDQAPTAVLANGCQCIPQHYLQFQHNYQSVSHIVSEISYSDRYPIFVCEDESGIYLQVGVIGVDNYRQSSSAELKIVYGRKWRVEPNLPSSEIIQTAFLAIKIAREHEVRELFRLDERGFICTPFNNHHDLPLMAQHQNLLQKSSSTNPTTKNDITNTLEKIHYDHCHFDLISFNQHKSNLWLLEIGIQIDDCTQLPELRQHQSLTLLLHQLDSNHLYHQLIGACLQLSNQHVEQNFYYKDFARFSREHSVEAIASLSASLRQQHRDTEFYTRFKQSNYDTDLTRIPKLDNSEYSDRLRQQIKQHLPLAGILPINTG